MGKYIGYSNDEEARKLMEAAHVPVEICVLVVLSVSGAATVFELIWLLLIAEEKPD